MDGRIALAMLSSFDPARDRVAPAVSIRTRFWCPESQGSTSVYPRIDEVKHRRVGRRQSFDLQ
jgi:hypothetical protein